MMRLLIRRKLYTKNLHKLSKMALTLICVIKLLKLSSIEGNFIYASLFYIFKQK